MELDLRDKLVAYYCDSLLCSYIYSEDLSICLKDRDITAEEWFLDFMEYNLNYNKEQHVLGIDERENCYTMLSRLLLSSIEKQDLEKIDKCNDLIEKLNLSSYENKFEYLSQLYINNSPNEKQAQKLVDKDMLDLTTVKYYFNYAVNLSYFLLEENEVDNKFNIDVELLNNEYVLFAMVEIIRRVPEVLKDVNVVSKLFGIIYANDKYIKMNKSQVKKHKYAVSTNRNAKRYLKSHFKKI